VSSATEHEAKLPSFLCPHAQEEDISLRYNEEAARLAYKFHFHPHLAQDPPGD